MMFTSHLIPWTPGVVIRNVSIRTTLLVSKEEQERRALFDGDPSWEEYKRRWAQLHGPIGDETDD